MYRNKPAKGFKSPLIIVPSTNIEEANNVSTNQQKTSNDSIKKLFRSTSQILNLFQKAIQENDENYIDENNIEVRGNESKKQDTSDPVETKRSTVASRSKM